MNPVPGQWIVSNPTEADTCRLYVVPKLQSAGWDSDPHSIAEQRQFTDGRIVVAGIKAIRQKRKKADYLLRYTPDFMIAVVEAKAEYKLPTDGLQQAKEYAQILGLKFAYSTNGKGIIEFDFTTGKELEIEQFPTPAELWTRLAGHDSLTEDQTKKLLTPYKTQTGRPPRYYQEIAINKAVQAILQGKRRNLLTLATGTGKTTISLQICWKLWSSGWNRTGGFRKVRARGRG
jgi:type I restriction enzyme R subunit